MGLQIFSKKKSVTKAKFLILVIGSFFALYFLLQFACKNKENSFPFFTRNDDVPSEVFELITRSPTFRERLILIDRKILNTYAANDDLQRTCIFCITTKKQPITFALLCCKNTSLEDFLKMIIWELGFSLEIVSSSRFKKFYTYRGRSPLGFILHKEKSVVIEIVILYEREGDFWWHGSFHQDMQYESALSYLNVSDIKNDFVLNREGAFDKFQIESVVIDGIKIKVPKNVTQFLKVNSKFIECNYEQAEKFYKMYGEDASYRATKFARNVRKMLWIVKDALDRLEIPFWLSSGTLLGFYRQCNVIPYTTDVDIEIFIDDYKYELIKALQSKKLKLRNIFGKIIDGGFELSFVMNDLKMDVFFVYDGGDHFWLGGIEKNSTDTLIRYKYKFPKFSLCWTEFLGLKLRIPCETEEYIKTEYGVEWFKPVKKWHWGKNPLNLEVAGVWNITKNPEVFQVFY